MVVSKATRQRMERNTCSRGEQGWQDDVNRIGQGGTERQGSAGSEMMVKATLKTFCWSVENMLTGGKNWCRWWGEGFKIPMMTDPGTMGTMKDTGALS
jgi:hypothetical protein